MKVTWKGSNGPDKWHLQKIYSRCHIQSGWACGQRSKGPFTAEEGSAGKGRERTNRGWESWDQRVSRTMGARAKGALPTPTPPRALIPPLYALIFKAMGHVKAPFPQALFTYHNPLIQIIIIFFIPSRQIIQTKFIWYNPISII